MNNIIPKTIKRTKLEFYKGFGLVEILVISAWIVLIALFIFGLPIGRYWKVLAIVLTSLFAIPLIMPIMTGVKGWYALVLAFKHLAQPKKYEINKRNDTNLLVPYEKIEKENYLKTFKLKGKVNYVAGFSVQGYNVSLLSNDQQYFKVQEFQDLFKYCDFPLTLMKMDLPPTNIETISFYEDKLKNYQKLFKSKKLNKEKFDILISQIKDYINVLKQSNNDSNGILPTQKQWFCFIYGRNIKQLEERIAYLENKLNINNFPSYLLSGYQLVKTIRLIWNPYEKPLLENDYQQNKLNINKLLAFNDFKIKKRYFKANDIYYNVSNIYDYPLTPSNGWGASLANNEQTIIWNIWPLNRTTMRKNLNKAINNAYTKSIMNRNNVDKSALSYEVQALEALNESINGANEVIKNVNISFLSYGTTIQLLKESQARLSASLKELDMKINPLTYRQLLGYSSILPNLQDPLMSNYGREIPAITIASSWPMINSGLNDPHGLYIGTNNTGDSIIYDQFLLNGYRKNFNQLLLGTAGSGKSFFTKKEIVFHLTVGRTVITIDPEREYKDLCSKYHGQWVDTTNSTSGRINPLQILDNNFKTELDKNEIISEFEKNNDEKDESPLSTHLRFLTSFFKILYPDLSTRELRVLIKEILKTYHKFKINNKTKVRNLANNKFPTMTDLYETVCQSWKENPTNTLSEIKDMIDYDFLGDGQYSRLWNGHTNLEIKNQFIVYDVFDLFDEGEQVVAAQLYLVLAFIKTEVKHNRFNDTKREIVIVVDEAHLTIDKDNPAALNFMFQMVKRIRKYHGAMIITTQNINDFTGTEDILKKTTAMLNNTQYTTIFNLKPKDLTAVDELYRSYGGLSEQEIDYISRAKTGQALFIVSDYERHCIKVEVTEKEKEGF